MQADIATLDRCLTSPPRKGIRTVYLFLTFALANFGIAWCFNTFVMTREVYHNLLGAQLDAARVDQIFDVLRQRSLWSYALIPVLVLVRVGFIALLLQLVLLLMAVEAPLPRLFRCSLWAFGVILIESVARVTAFSLMDSAGIDAVALSTDPASLGYWVLASRETSELSIALSPLTLTAIGWLLALIVSLSAVAGVSLSKSIAAAASVWVVASIVQMTFALYFFGL